MKIHDYAILRCTRPDLQLPPIAPSGLYTYLITDQGKLEYVCLENFMTVDDFIAWRSSVLLLWTDEIRYEEPPF